MCIYNMYIYVYVIIYICIYMESESTTHDLVRQSLTEFLE